MITRSEKQTERARLQRKIDAMPKVKGTWHKVTGTTRNEHIFVPDGKDPKKAIENYRIKHGFVIFEL